MDKLAGNVGRLLRLLDDASADDRVLQYIRQVVRRSQHVLRRDRRQLTAQLKLRADAAILEDIARTLLEPERLARGLRFSPVQQSEDDGSSGLIMIVGEHHSGVRGADYIPDVGGRPAC